MPPEGAGHQRAQRTLSEIWHPRSKPFEGAASDLHIDPPDIPARIASQFAIGRLGRGLAPRVRWNWLCNL